MIRLEFTFADVSNAKAFLDKLADQPAMTYIEEVLAPQEAPPLPEAQVPAASVTRARGRPKKTEAAAPAVANNAPADPVTATAATPVTQAPTAPPAAASALPVAPVVTIDDVRATAQKVVEKLGNDVGLERARKAIREVGGVVTIRDIPGDKAAAVNTALQALLV